jgi:hypothetical protein
MRLPRVRLTVRRLLVAVAVVEAAAGVEALRRRSEGFRELALYHASEETLYLDHARLWDEGQSAGCTEIPPDATPEEYAQGARRCRLRAAYAAGLSRKYERAAARPWLPVAPDPPRPD